MQKELSPKVTIAVIGVAVIGFVIFAVMTFLGPSARRAPDATKGPVAPTAGGGPTEADLQKMREYNAAHPEARSNYR